VTGEGTAPRSANSWIRPYRATTYRLFIGLTSSPTPEGRSYDLVGLKVVTNRHTSRPRRFYHNALHGDAAYNNDNSRHQIRSDSDLFACTLRTDLCCPGESLSRRPILCI